MSLKQINTAIDMSDNSESTANENILCIPENIVEEYKKLNSKIDAIIIKIKNRKKKL